MRSIGLLIAVLAAVAFSLPAEAGGSRGCGSRGGPGYRGPDGQCVGKKNLNAVCGVPPTSKCTYEGR